MTETVEESAVRKILQGIDRLPLLVRTVLQAAVLGVLAYALLSFGSAVVSWFQRAPLAELMQMKTLQGRIPVRILPLDEAKGEFVAKVVSTGTVFPLYETPIHPRVEGWVEEIPVDEGAHVKKGDLLVRLDRREIETRLAASRARLEFAKSEFERAKTLLESKAIDASRYEDAERTLEASRAAVERLKTILDYTEIRAPFDGGVARRWVDPGALVMPNTPLVTLADMSRMRVQVRVAEKHLAHLSVGSEAIVRLRPLENALIPGSGVFASTVSTIFPEVDPETRTATVEVLLDNGEGATRPGMFAIVELVLKRKTNAWFVPREAVVEQDGRPVVFLYKPWTLRAHMVEVVTGMESQGKVEILKGLAEAAGEKDDLGNTPSLIVDNPRLLKDGQEVSVRLK